MNRKASDEPMSSAKRAVAAATNSGFALFVAFKVDDLNSGHDILGNSSSVGATNAFYITLDAGGGFRISTNVGITILGVIIPLLY